MKTINSRRARTKRTVGSPTPNTTPAPAPEMKKDNPISEEAGALKGRLETERQTDALALRGESTHVAHGNGWLKMVGLFAEFPSGDIDK